MPSSENLPALKDELNSVRGLLDKMQGQFQMAFPTTVKFRPEQFLRVAMTTISRNPDLLRCTKTSLLGCLMQAAQLGLQIDGLLGEAHLVPFNAKQEGGGWAKEVQLIVGYKGYMKLARNSGEVSTIKSSVVYIGDPFEIRDGLDPILNHTVSEQRPDPEKYPTLESAVRGAYAICWMKDGTKTFIYLPKWKIDDARRFSRAKSGPWFTNYPEMAEKTAIRRLAKYMPQSADIQRAAALAELADAGISQELELPELPEGLVAGALTAGSPEATGPTGSKLDSLVEEENRRKATKATGQGQPANTTQPEKEKTAGSPSPGNLASTPLDNPNYGVGSDGDPMLEGHLFRQGRSE